MWGLLWVPLGPSCLLAGFRSRRGRPYPDYGLQSMALRFHANVAVMLEHLLGNVPSDIHDGLIASAAFRKVGD